MFGSASIVTGIICGIGFSYSMPSLISTEALDFDIPEWWPAYNWWKYDEVDRCTLIFVKMGQTNLQILEKYTPLKCDQTTYIIRHSVYKRFSWYISSKSIQPTLVSTTPYYYAIAVEYLRKFSNLFSISYPYFTFRYLLMKSSEWFYLLSSKNCCYIQHQIFINDFVPNHYNRILPTVKIQLHFE